MKWIFNIVDIFRIPRVLEIVWHLLTEVSALTEQEIKAGIAVLGTDAISYSAVRVAQRRILNVIFKLNGNRAFATFHTINLPQIGSNARAQLDVTVHELIHVFQYERIGSVYIWEAIRAQQTKGYSYGGWQQLQHDRENGKHFRDFNREQQAQIAQDYYNYIVDAGRAVDDPIRKAYELFINELKDGDL